MITVKQDFQTTYHPSFRKTVPHQKTQKIYYKHTEKLNTEAKDLLKKVIDIFSNQNNEETTLSAKLQNCRFVQFNKASKEICPKPDLECDYYVNTFRRTQESCSIKSNRDIIFNIKGDKLEVYGNMSKIKRQSLNKKLVRFLNVLLKSGQFYD